MKKVLLAASIASALSLFNFAHAAGGTIEFNGTITAATCAVTVDDGAGTVSSVNLPGVGKDQLSGVNSVAGRTMFLLKATGCDGFTTLASKQVAAFFNPDAANVDAATGLLNNIAPIAGKATNVQLELIDGTTNSPIKVGFASQATSAGFVNIIGTAGSGTATLPYFVQYKSVTGSATAGAVKGSVTFDLMYK